MMRIIEGIIEINILELIGFVEEEVEGIMMKNDKNDFTSSSEALKNDIKTNNTSTSSSSSSSSSSASASSSPASSTSLRANDKHLMGQQPEKRQPCNYAFKLQSILFASTTASLNNNNNINNNNNNNNNNYQQQQKAHQQRHRIGGKYMTWSWRFIRRKQFLCLFFIAVVIVYVNTVLDNSDNQEHIPVVHYSHVPGMKEAKMLHQNVSEHEFISKANATTATKINDRRNESMNSSTELNNDFASSNSIDSFAIPQLNANLLNYSTITNNSDFNETIRTIHSNNSIIKPTTSSQLTNAGSGSTADVNATQQNDVLFETKTTTTTTNKQTSPNATTDTTNMPPEGYLVWSERCKMPNINPYLPEVMRYFKREKYKPCSDQVALTSVAYSAASQTYVLRINEDLIRSYTKAHKIDCCYQVIERNGTGLQADKESSISLSDCIGFAKSTSLGAHIDNILVKCHAKKKQIYINGHAMMPERAEIRERVENWKRDDRQNKRQPPPSVMMIGIDSISRINLIRAMPKTAQYLYDNEWFEMSGYNKIDDNTFPNLMAVLTGMNKTTAYHKCPPTVLHGLDDCNIIWRTFRDHGYVTAYAEDGASINTFNYMKVGFERPPVDYYMRPFLLAAEKQLHLRYKSSLIYCLGYQHSAEFIYEYALELVRRYKRQPYFGLFWTNTFSHNAISDCSSMDKRMVEYLKRFSEVGTLDNSIVIFFSDHGLRFGPTRATYSGHLEERLPFMFIWLPPHMKQTHPEFVNALSVNKNRLTNPYDLHMTLKHILRLSGRVKDKMLLQQAENCEHCQTLLEPVPHNRSCNDVAIEDHWCTCIPYQNVYKKSPIVLKLAKAAVDYINNYVANYKNATFAKICAPLQLLSVDSAYRAQPQYDAHVRGATGSGQTTTSANDNNHRNKDNNIIKNKSNIRNNNNNSNNNSNSNKSSTSADDAASFVETYRLIFQTKPNKAIFEATIRYNPKAASNETFQVTGEISRLNSYASDSECAEDGGAKKYCSCRKRKGA